MISERIDSILYDYQAKTAHGCFPDLMVIGVNVERALWLECRGSMFPEKIVADSEYRGVRIIVSRSLRADEIWVPPPDFLRIQPDNL